MPKTSFLFPSLVLIVSVSACDLLTPLPPPPQAATMTTSPLQVTPLAELPPTWTPAPTLTPTITLTPSPTSPPPTATPNLDDFDIEAMMTEVPATSLPDLPETANWKTISGQTASFQVPPGYQEIDLGQGFGQLMQAFFEFFGETLNELAEEINPALESTPRSTAAPLEEETLPWFDFLIALNEETTSAVVLYSEERTTRLTTEDLLNQALTGTETNFQLNTRQEIVDAQRPTERVILDVMDAEFGPGKQIIYGVLGEDYAWTLIFTSPAASFGEELPVFEAVAASINPAE